ncbi:MAG: hypothetical protein AAF975_08290, partial [Spirochaetota bacterium]
MSETLVQKFLEKYGLACARFHPQALLRDYCEEMEHGLNQSGSLKMLPAYISADKPLRYDQAALVLDAGGTHLRCALVTVPKQGKPLLECFHQCEMPGLKKTLSAAEFFCEIARFMAEVLEEFYQRYRRGPLCLGFCFSYPSEITMSETGDLDGRLLQWSKEIKVPELEGKFVGSGLLSVLRETFGDKAPCHVCVINDTVATLLAGRSCAEDADYSDFIGYILGTGINSCYAENSENIRSLDPRYRAKQSIINMESGNYNRFPRSRIDEEYDRMTQHPGTYLQEKSCSGRYWGELVGVVLRTAAQEGLLPKALADLPLQNSATMNALLLYPGGPLAAANPLALWLSEYDIDEDARECIYFLTEAMLERNAM